MRILVAGATGVIGRQLVPMLAAAGHDVVGLARSDRRASPGQRLVLADALDRAGLVAAVREVAPDAVVHLLTAIPQDVDPRHVARDFALTNRLRTEGTRNLLAAAPGARFVAQSITFLYRQGPGAADEDSPLWTDPPAARWPVFEAARDLERQTTAAGGLVLRFGALYGPGTSFALDSPMVARLRARRFPVVGDGGGVFSFTHTHDAASAIMAALDRTGVVGVLNVVDDDPAPVRAWLPELARMLGAPAPRRVPALLVRLLAGGYAVALLTKLRGADNARARRLLDWRPRYPSWRAGFAAELGPPG